MRPLELARQYLDIFFGGKNMEVLGELFADDFGFTGPLAQYNSAGDYINALKADSPKAVQFKIIRTFEDDSSACVIYEFSKPGINTPMAQLFEIRDGRISRILLIFDTAEFT